MKHLIRIGTRKSPLAVVQAQLVADALLEKHPEIQIELIKIETKGDRFLDKPLLDFGGKGAFVSEFEKALLEGTIDLAVHSAKDLPMKLAEGLSIVSVLEREDPRDVLVSLQKSGFSEKEELVIGTSSLRRKFQAVENKDILFPHQKVIYKDIRGNIQTRLKHLEDGGFDGLILAAAGLKRLHLLEDKTLECQMLDAQIMIPAGGQGILAVEGIAHSYAGTLCKDIQNRDSRICFDLERIILNQLNAGCHEPIGVYAQIEGETDLITVLGVNQKEGQKNKIHVTGSLSCLDSLAEQAVAGLEVL